MEFALHPIAARRTPYASFLLAALGICVAGQAEAQTKFSYRFPPGETIQQDIVQTVQVDVTPPGEKKVFTTQVDQTWVLESVGGKPVEDALMPVRQKFALIKFALQLPAPFSKRFTVDTSQPEPSEDETENGMREAIGKVVGLEWTTTFHPTGEIEEVAISEELGDVLVENPQVGPLTETFSDVGLRKLWDQVAVTFPDRPLSKGDEWEQTVTQAFPEGKLTTLRKCTHAGRTADGVDRITVVMQAEYASVAKAKQPMELSQNSGEGEWLYDPRLGRLVRGELTQVLKFKSGPADRQGTQTITMKNRLLPPVKKAK